MHSRIAITLRTAVSVGLVFAGVILGFVSRKSGWRPGDLLAALSYDTLHTLGTREPDAGESFPVALVYLDLPSFQVEGVDASRPWPRELHARLVKRLSEAGARAIVFDVLFADPGDEPGDAAFAQALRASGRVVLAGQATTAAGRMTDLAKPWERLLHVEVPLPRFATNAAAWGLADQIPDEDYVVRRHYVGSDSQDLPALAWAVAEWLKLPVASGTEARSTARSRWIRYRGPALTLPHVGYTQALHPEGVSDAFFRDRVVFVGARPMAGGFVERRDEFRSPFHSWRHRELFHPGVEVHATEFLDLARGDWLRRSDPWLEKAVIVLVAVMGGVGFVRLRPLAATGVAFLLVVLTAGAALAAFAHGVWFPWLVVGLVQVPASLFGSWLLHFGDWYVTRGRLEAARRADEARIREQAALIDKASDAIFVVGLDGRVRYANPAAVALYGWSAEELRGSGSTDPAWPRRPLASFEATPWSEARAACLARGEWRGEMRLSHRSGAGLVVAGRWTLIRDHAGRAESILVLDTDVTALRQLEAESLRLQRTEAIGALASGMAHDLNNALAPVLMGAQWLRRGLVDEESRRVLQLMENGTRRGADMVRQVVLFARGKPGESELLDLRPLVKEMEKLARDTFPKSIAVASHLPADAWPVRGNPTEIHQVLLNLCVNARDAMPGGGSLDLALDHVTLDEAEARAIPGGTAGTFAVLIVSDTGAGIPADVLPRIFEPFFTTKTVGAGTGLGLSTTARIVKAHGGFLQVTSQPGEGTTFEIFLPRAAAVAAAAPRESEAPIPRGQGEWILVADDDRAVGELLGRALEDHGYRVVVAFDGSEAIRCLEDPARSISFFLCDRDMPGLDGPSVIRRARELRPGLRWLLLSGVDRPEDRESGRAIAKPFSLPGLLRRLREELDGDGARAAQEP